MRHLIVGYIVAACLTTACASTTVSHDVAVKQDVVLAIDALGVFAKGIEALADATPPVITREQAFQVLDIDKAAVIVLRNANLGSYGVLKEVLDQVSKLSFAAKIQKYIDLARITLAALTPTTSVSTSNTTTIGSQSIGKSRFRLAIASILSTDVFFRSVEL